MRCWIVSLLFVLGACATKPPQAPVFTAQDQQFAVRNQGYSLLFKLLSDEKDVSKLLLVKKEQPDVGALLKKISEISGAAAKQLEAFSKADPHLHLEMDGLPLAEKQTRDLIGKTHAKELISKSGDKFELRILLTQAEALTYGAHLAVIIQGFETDSARQKFLADTSQRYQELHQSLIDLMHTRWKMPSTK